MLYSHAKVYSVEFGTLCDDAEVVVRDIGFAQVC